MSFDKDYPNRKDKRKQYKKTCERVDRSCRPGGDCPYCKKNREHSCKKREPIGDGDDQDVVEHD